MKRYVTITGINHYFGNAPFKKGKEITLVKEPHNEYDHEAIRAQIPALGKVGYVANSTHTVIGTTMSAGRVYDHIGKTAKATVVYVLPAGIICKIKK